MFKLVLSYSKLYLVNINQLLILLFGGKHV